MKKRILIADASPDLIERIRQDPQHTTYEWKSVFRGSEVLPALGAFAPDLILIDLMLPEKHGIELLKEIRSQAKWKNLGILLISTNSMIQNFHSALKVGANYFLAKPVDLALLFSLIERFFQSGLKPDAFEEHYASDTTPLYLPRPHDPHSYLKFWGTRGSNPVSGPEYLRFGGNTACLEVRQGEDRLIIDAGTGIRPLGQLIEAEGVKRIHLFLSHTHWDHITGFPFFAPLYHPEVELIIWSPVGFDKSTKELFTDMLAYAYFPVRLEDIKCTLTFKDLRAGQSVEIGSIRVDSHYAYHPGATLCFKLHMKEATVGYATDNELFLGFHGNPSQVKKGNPLLTSHAGILNFFKGCDLLIHEAQYTPQEYQRRVGWGHCSVSNAALLCKEAGIQDWIFTHHDPSHTDEQLLAKLQLHKDILRDCVISCGVRAAFDGMTLPL